ncbi:MAG TPA: methyltransferase domain-containing protein [Clostridia bacterium]|nr:methyltransferase domain-containing protein [Clostridia bacterium]
MLSATRYHEAMHLEAEQLAAELESCPICGSRGPRRPAGRIQSDPSVHLLSCPNCGGCSASHMPIPQVLEAYYDGYYRGDGPRVTLAQVHRFVNNLVRVIAFERRPGPLRLLDFGGGDGTIGLAVALRILEEMPERQVQFVLVDYEHPCAFEPHARLEVLHQRSLDRVKGPFDLVLAGAVLEHIPELRSTLEQLFGKLGPGGWFYARTPYVVPLKRLLPSLDITYPGHVHDLGAPFWNRVPRTYALPLRVVVSRPSLVETHWLRQPARTVLAWLMKLPARIELAGPAYPRTPWWRLVGGWEVILQRAA